MQRTAVIGAIVMCSVIGVWMGTVLSTAQGTSLMTCPSTPAWLAPGMRITTVATSSCEKVLGEMEARVTGQSRLVTKAWQDPHDHGWYTARKYGGSFSTARISGDGKYRYKQIFTLSPHGTDSCKIEACSRSQGRYSDNGTNYCNLKMLFCGTADGCKFVNDNLFFASESTQKIYQASVDLKKCFEAGTDQTQEEKDLQVQSESTSSPEAEPAGQDTEKTAAQPAEEQSQKPAEETSDKTTGQTSEKTSEQTSEKMVGEASEKASDTVSQKMGIKKALVV